MDRTGAPDSLSRDEAAALAYFAMGIASEGSLRGRHVAYRLGFAGRIQEGELFPVGNSGYSIGTLQTDLGQHPAAAVALVAAYREWSAARPGPAPITADDARGWTELERMLSRTGRQIRREGGTDIAAGVKADLQGFLASDAGIDFVHRRDVAQVDRLLRPDSGRQRSALHSIADTDLYREAGPDDRARLAAVFLKLENQSGRGIYPALVERIRSGELTDLEAVTDVIEARKDYVSSGVRSTLAGTEAWLALRDMPRDHPMGAAADRVLREPLVHPASLTTERGGDGPTLGEYHAVTTMFLQPRTATAFLHALEGGRTFGHGNPETRGSGFFAFAEGFAFWDGDGRGHVVGGDTWRSIDRRGLRRVDLAGDRIDLVERHAAGETRLLRVDPSLPPPAPAGTSEVPRPAPPEGAAPEATFAPSITPALPLDPALQARVRALGDRIGTPDPAAIDRITASLMHVAAAAGLQRVQHLAIGGERLLAWDGDPANPATRWSAVPLEQAQRTDTSISLRAVARLRGAGPDIARPMDARTAPDHLQCHAWNPDAAALALGRP